jgi:hypothetical protein
MILICYDGSGDAKPQSSWARLLKDSPHALTVP